MFAANTISATWILDRIGAFFTIERNIMGKPPDERRTIRQAEAKPLLDDLGCFMDENLPLLPGRGSLAGAIRYSRSRWAALTRYVEDGRLEISNNAAERAIRPLALGRHNWVFLGSNAGGLRTVAIFTRDSQVAPYRSGSLSASRARSYRGSSHQPDR